MYLKFVGVSMVLLGALLISSCNSNSTSMNEPLTGSGNMVSQKISLYVDVREQNEWDAGHIQGAMHIPLGDIESGKYSQIPKDIPVFLYCRSGRRSGIAYDILRKAGYTNISNVGGMAEVPQVTIVQ